MAVAALPVVGFLSSAFRDRDAGRLLGFRKGLDEGGYIEGHNVSIEQGECPARTLDSPRSPQRREAA